MSGDLYAQPGIINQVYCDQDDKERIVNIYVSAESLRVYDKPWVEVTSPNTPPEAQHPGTEVCANKFYSLYFYASIYLILSFSMIRYCVAVVISCWLWRGVYVSFSCISWIAAFNTGELKTVIDDGILNMYCLFVSVIRGNSGTRNHIRTDSVFLGVLCLLLLAGIIFLGVKSEFFLILFWC